MNFEPQKFFIGLVDFFSILMPGAMLSYLWKDNFVHALQPSRNSFPLDSAENVLVFLFASYLIGHFVFLLSSALDDLVYDRLRAWTDWGQIEKRLAKGKGLVPRWKRTFAKSSFLFGKSADNAVMRVQVIKARALQGLSAETAINAFQWSKTRLTKDLPDGLLTVHRFEAGSKFFRSFVVVLGVLTVSYGIGLEWIAFSLCLAGIVPALWRYMDQRFKATQQAYWFIITLEAMKANPPAPPREGLTHAGGIVFRREDKVIKFLLVQANNDRSKWVLPKGHIEPGETQQVTAVREVKEESGHWARIIGWIEDARLGSDAASLTRFFLMELVEAEKAWPPENRGQRWLPLTEAEELASYDETKKLLIKADGLLHEKPAPVPFSRKE